MLNVGIPYLRTLSPDGRVTPDIIERATMGSGGEIAKGVIWYFLDHAAAERGDIVIKGDLDQNGDGAISIDDEFLPALDELLNIEVGGASIYAAENALPSTTQQAAHIEVPVLILQGENDAATAAKDVYRLEEGLRDHSR